MIYLAIGRRERGKTTLVFSLARKLPQRIVFDPRRQIEVASPRATIPDQIEEWIDRMFEGRDIPELLIVPAGHPQPAFDVLADAAQRWIEADPTRPLALVLDESRFMDLSRDSFQWVLRCAPRSMVHVFLTAHRPSDIPTDVRAIADQWLIFHSTQEHDLRVIRDRCGDACADHVARLAAYEWVQWDDGKGEYRLHRDPRVWYTPLRTMPDPVAPVVTGGHASVSMRRLFDA